MVFDLEQHKALAAVMPWECHVRVGGKQYRIRRLTNADVLAFTRLGKLPPAEQEAFVIGLFEGDVPAVRDWDQDTFAGFFASVTGYVQARAAEAFRQAVERASAAARMEMRTPLS